jgi:hypothetical protein
MTRFFKTKREIIFFTISIFLLIITILYIVSSVRFLVGEISKAVSSEDLLESREPASFNLEKFEELNLSP